MMMPVPKWVAGDSRGTPMQLVQRKGVRLISHHHQFNLLIGYIEYNIRDPTKFVVHQVGEERPRHPDREYVKKVNEPWFKRKHEEIKQDGDVIGDTQLEFKMPRYGERTVKNTVSSHALSYSITNNEEKASHNSLDVLNEDKNNSNLNNLNNLNNNNNNNKT